jgi:hypothetical protein
MIYESALPSFHSNTLCPDILRYLKPEVLSGHNRSYNKENVKHGTT